MSEQNNQTCGCDPCDCAAEPTGGCGCQDTCQCGDRCACESCACEK